MVRHKFNDSNFNNNTTVEFRIVLQMTFLELNYRDADIYKYQ